MQRRLSHRSKHCFGATLLAAVGLLASIASQAACLDQDKACIKAAQTSHVVNRIAYWKKALERPLEQRIGSAPAELVEYIRLDNVLNGFRERPKPALISPGFRRDLDAALFELPSTIKQVLEGRLAGIYLVQGLGGSGFTDKILDVNGKPVAAYVILDVDVLSQRDANQWATWKERTPFSSDDGTTLAAMIEQPDYDNRKNAIQYILLHELGHVLSVGRHVHPGWWEDHKEINLAEYPFLSLSWVFSKGAERFIANDRNRFPLQARVVYYLGAKLGTSQIVPVYEQLENTDFPTLYAATNPYDDFAESFASYVHTVMLHKPFEIRIERGGKVVKRIESCWETPRCRDKRKVLEEVIHGL